MLQVRNLSPQTHDILRLRAANARQSLSDYVAVTLDDHARHPRQEEWWGELETHPPARASFDSVAALSAVRRGEH
jgi:hypothetical protein